MKRKPHRLLVLLRTLFVVVMIVMLNACSATQPVRVLRDGQSALTGSLGGPVVPGKSPLGFIPYLNVGYLYGLSDEITLQTSAHALPAVFGTLGLDLGLATRLCREKSWQPELTMKVQTLLFTDFQAARCYPLLSLVGSYEIGERSLFYGGLETVFQFNDSKLYYTPLLGVQLPLSKSTTIQTECKWMASNINTSSGVFEGLGAISSHGAFGIFVGLNYAL